MASSTGTQAGSNLNIFEKQDGHRGYTVAIRDVDIAAGLDLDKPLDPDIATRIRHVHH